MWTRVGSRLNNWGQKITTVAKKAGGYVVRAAKWVAGTKAVQWTVSKSKFILGRAWHYAKGPIGWVAAPIAAVIFAPKAVAVMLVLVMIALAVIGFIAWKSYKHLRTISTEEELREMVEEITAAVAEGRDANGTLLTYTEEPTATETVAERLVFLDAQNKDAAAASDANRFSETTARMWLLEVRSGKTGKSTKLKKDDSVAEIYRECKRRSLKQNAEFEWNLTLMYRATSDENKRLKAIEKLKAQQAKLTSV